MFLYFISLSFVTMYFFKKMFSMLYYPLNRRRTGMNNASRHKEQSKSNIPHLKHSSKERKYADFKGKINKKLSDYELINNMKRNTAHQEIK